MSATAVSLPPSPSLETTDFLRRLAAMMRGGQNAEMLLQAASQIESLTRRALSAEQLYDGLRDESARSTELRRVAEMASDNLITEVDGLRQQLVDLAREANEDRTRLTAEGDRLYALAEDAEARLARALAELGELRAVLRARSASVVTVPVHTLRLAQAQFNHLAQGFARSGDLISQTICEIGGCAIGQALAGAETEETP